MLSRSGRYLEGQMSLRLKVGKHPLWSSESPPAKLNHAGGSAPIDVIFIHIQVKKVSNGLTQLSLFS